MAREAPAPVLPEAFQKAVSGGLVLKTPESGAGAAAVAGDGPGEVRECHLLP